MKIVLMTDNHALSGGAEKYFFDLKTRLQQQGHDVFSLGFGAEEANGDDYHVIKVSDSKWKKLLWQYFLHPVTYWQLRKHLKRFQPDVIHLHNNKQHPLAVLAAIRPYPTVQTIHDYSAVCPLAHNLHQDHEPCPTGWRRQCFWKHHVKFPTLVYLALVGSYLRITHLVKRHIAAFFTPSPLLADYLTRNGYRHTQYIPPFKEPINLAPITVADPYHFFFAGNLGIHKGIYVLIDELALALQTEPRLTLTIAGKGPEEAALLAYIAKLGLQSSVNFIGWHTDINDEYRRAIAIILPSIVLESFGLVISEAMQHGRAVIGTNRGAPTWLIDDGVTGLIFNPLVKGDLASKLLQLCANVPLAEKMGLSGHQKIEALLDNEASLQSIITTYRAIAIKKGA